MDPYKIPEGIKYLIEIQKKFQKTNLLMQTSSLLSQPVLDFYTQSYLIQSKLFNANSVFKRPPDSSLERISKLIQSNISHQKLINEIKSTDEFVRELLEKRNQDDLIQVDIDISNIIRPEDTNAQVLYSKEIKQILFDVYHNNEKLLTVHPRKFEEMIAELLYAQGYQVELTGQTRDGGYDIIALKKIDQYQNLKFLVECKRYTSDPVGIDIIRQFNYILNKEKANKGIIVATSYFTEDAKKERELTPYLLDFRDREKVLEWIADYYKSKMIIK